MELCCICHKIIRIGDTGTLTLGKNDISKVICAKCEKQIDILTNNDNVNEIKSAINYLYSYKVKNGDEEVTSYLDDILEANRSVLEEIDSAQDNNCTISMGSESDYFKDKEENKSGNFSGQYSFCNKPEKIAVSIFDSAKTITALGIITATIYFIIGAINLAASSQLFVFYLGLFIMSLLIFFAFRLLVKILKGFAAIVQNTRDMVRLQKQQADDIAVLIQKYNK